MLDPPVTTSVFEQRSWWVEVLEEARQARAIKTIDRYDPTQQAVVITVEATVDQARGWTFS